MDTNLVFFDDFNATSNTSSGENHRSLNNVLFFFLNYHKGTFLADTIFFDTHYQTIDNRNIVGVLPILFSICEIDRSKGHTEPYRVCRRLNILRDYSDEKTKLYPRN